MYITSVDSNHKTNTSFKSKFVAEEHLKSVMKFHIEKCNYNKFSLDSFSKSAFYASMKTLINDGKNDTIKLSGDYAYAPISKYATQIDTWSILNVNNNNFPATFETNFARTLAPERWGSYRMRIDGTLALDCYCSRLGERLVRYVKSKDDLYGIYKNISKKEGLDDWINRETIDLYVTEKLKDIYKKIFPTEKT